MPYSIRIDGLPAGRTLTYVRKGESAPIQTCGFITSDDGVEFSRFAEGTSGQLSELFGRNGPLWESQVDHLLAIYHKDSRVDVYCNELQLMTEVRAKNAITAGQEVHKNDIADITRLKPRTRKGVEILIPKDAGVEFMFSARWRKGVYFDFSPLMPEGCERGYEIEKALGTAYGRLVFCEFFSLTETDWDQLFDWGLFPFAALTTEDRENLIEAAKNAHFSADLIQSICRQFRASAFDKINSWETSSILSSNLRFIRVAAERYLASDYVSAIQVLFPRIEGVLRECLKVTGSGLKATQSSLANCAGLLTPEESLLFPRRFERFLERFYFRNFDVVSGVLDLSRNSLAHGVSRFDDYSELQAAVGFLILDQIFYYSGKRDN